MRRKSPRRGSLSDYIAEILKNAVYEKGEQLDVIVAEAPDLPGCLTQGATFEEARANLVDAIEVWLMSGLRSGEDPPVVNGCQLAITAAPRRPASTPPIPIFPATITWGRVAWGTARARASWTPLGACTAVRTRLSWEAVPLRVREPSTPPSPSWRSRCGRRTTCCRRFSEPPRRTA